MHTDRFVACMDKNWQWYQMNSWKEHVNVGTCTCTGEVKCVYTIKYMYFISSSSHKASSRECIGKCVEGACEIWVSINDYFCAIYPLTFWQAQLKPCSQPITDVLSDVGL